MSLIRCQVNIDLLQIMMPGCCVSHVLQRQVIGHQPLDPRLFIFIYLIIISCDWAGVGSSQDIGIINITCYRMFDEVVNINYRQPALDNIFLNFGVPGVPVRETAGAGRRLYRPSVSPRAVSRDLHSHLAVVVTEDRTQNCLDFRYCDTTNSEMIVIT